MERLNAWNKYDEDMKRRFLISLMNTEDSYLYVKLKENV